MTKREIELLIENQVRKVNDDEPEPELCGCDESQHYLMLLVRLRAEFDYLFKERDTNTNYAAMLEILIENRLAEARMYPRMFGEAGIAGLPAPYKPEQGEGG